MWTWHTFWMVLHILGAVIAFGPMFAQPMIASFGRKNPQHAVLAAEISQGIAARYTIPFGLTLPISGAALMATDDIDFLDNRWLSLSVVLFAVALVFALLVQRPKARRMLQLLRSRPSGPPSPGQGPLPGQGPPPEMMALGRTLARGLAFLILLITAIFVLMIWQPGGVGRG